jgi:prepilin-type N-terminal cleavage/methylation domain-containing protein
MRSFMKRKSNLDSGFTLIELLVVIIIIGILAGIAVIGVRGAQRAAIQKSCIADATQITKGVRAYYALNNTFPTALANLVPDFLENLPQTTNYDLSFAIDGNSVVVTEANAVCGPIRG